MQKALRDYEIAKRVGINGRKVAEAYFDKNNQAALLLQFLNSL